MTPATDLAGSAAIVRMLILGDGVGTTAVGTQALSFPTTGWAAGGGAPSRDAPVLDGAASDAGDQTSSNAIGDAIVGPGADGDVPRGHFIGTDGASGAGPHARRPVLVPCA